MKNVIKIFLLFFLTLNLIACDTGYSVETLGTIKTKTPVGKLEYSEEPKLYYFESNEDLILKTNEFLQYDDGWFDNNSLLIVTLMDSNENTYSMNDIMNGNIGINREINSYDKDTYVILTLKIKGRMKDVESHVVNFLDINNVQEDTYADLNEVLGFDKSEVTKVQYVDKSLEDAMFLDANVEYTINKLDVEYSRIEKTALIEAQLVTHIFYIYNEETAITCSWLSDKRVLFTSERWYYFSKEPVELLPSEKPNDQILSFLKTDISANYPASSKLILDILDTLSWKSVIASYDDIKHNTISHLLSITRTIEKGIDDTVWQDGHELLIGYYINYETGFVYMSPAMLSTNIHDLYAFLTEEQLNEVKALGGYSERVYTLKEVLGFDGKEISNIKYKDYNTEEERFVGVREFCEVIDSNFEYINQSVETGIPPKAIITIKRGNEEIVARLLRNNILCINGFQTLEAIDEQMLQEAFSTLEDNKAYKLSEVLPFLQDEEVLEITYTHLLFNADTKKVDYEYFEITDEEAINKIIANADEQIVTYNENGLFIAPEWYMPLTSHHLFKVKTNNGEYEYCFYSNTIDIFSYNGFRFHYSANNFGVNLYIEPTLSLVMTFEEYETFNLEKYLKDYDKE